MMRALRRLANHIQRKALGQWIDRLDQRQLVGIRLRYDAVRVDHLQHAVIESSGAGHDAPLADRQELFEVVAARVEIGQRQRAGSVVGLDPIGRALQDHLSGTISVRE